MGMPGSQPMGQPAYGAAPMGMPAGDMGQMGYTQAAGMPQQPMPQMGYGMPQMNMGQMGYSISLPSMVDIDVGAAPII